MRQLRLGLLPSSRRTFSPPPSASPFFHAPPPHHLHPPSHLAKSIFTSEASQEGERKQVTVLCSDLKGSTEYIADLDPEEARSLLDPVLERMMDAVGRYEGTINQVMGDGNPGAVRRTGRV